VQACAVFLPSVGIPFFLLFGKRNERDLFTRYLPAFTVGLFILAAAALLIEPRLTIREIHFTEGGLFWGLTFSWPGKAVGAYLLLTNVFLLYLFENTYRSADVAGKVTLKYPLLGIITASILNFVVLSRMLSLSVLGRNFFAIHSCGLLTFSLSFLYSTFRYQLFDVKVYIGRGVASSVVTVIIAGLYLVSLALISYLAKVLGLPYDRFTSTVFGIFAVFLLVAVLISGKAKRRLRQFLNENFYLTRYDYRGEWRRYARLMASSSTIDYLLANLAGSLCETMLVKKALFWTDAMGGRQTAYGVTEGSMDRRFVQKLKNAAGGESVLVLDRRAAQTIGDGEDAPVRGVLTWLRAAAFLGQDESFTGIIALGDKDTGAPYSNEDVDFLATIADQASLTLENLLMEERILESNQIASFNRFASFVVHDLKNTVGMLSLTAENARDNIADADFQRDAIETINRSVAKMKRLIASLNAHKAPDSISKKRIDVCELCRNSVSNLAQVAESRNVTVETECSGRLETMADPSAIKRVIENIVLNAIEATPAGGRVAIEAAGEDGGMLGITVRDTGSGFEPAYLKENLFKQFQSTKSGGLGIGLVLCKSLVEAHGGTISIASERGSGAEVTVRLPIESDAVEGGARGAE